MGAVRVEAITIRGSCPTVAQPFLTADGLLARLRVPGGMLTIAQTKAVAAAAERATGPIEITNRANLQVRGAPDDLVRALEAAGLTAAGGAPRAAFDLLASPTAGVDPGELLDTRPYVAALAAAPDVGPRPTKAGVVVDGGGRVHVRAARRTVALGARRHRDGTLWFEVRAGTALDAPAHGPGGCDLLPLVPLDRAVPTALAVLAGRLDEAGVVGAVAAVATIATIADVVWFDPVDLEPPRGPTARPIGALPQAGTRTAVGVAPLLGRLSPAVLAAVARRAEHHGAREIRLTPWRGIVVPDVDPGETLGLLEALGALGLVVRSDDPALDVVACAGRTGCPEGMADTQADALAMIEHLRGSAPAARPSSVHFSGCPKRCASRDQFSVTYVAGPDGYRIEH